MTYPPEPRVSTPGASLPALHCIVGTGWKSTCNPPERVRCVRVSGTSGRCLSHQGEICSDSRQFWTLELTSQYLREYSPVHRNCHGLGWEYWKFRRCHRLCSKRK